MLSLRNAGDSNEDVVRVDNPSASTTQNSIISDMMASGFRQSSADSRFAYFLPCPLGTFSNITSKGTDECSACPPGILYIDLSLSATCAISAGISLRQIYVKRCEISTKISITTNRRKVTVSLLLWQVFTN